MGLVEKIQDLTDDNQQTGLVERRRQRRSPVVRALRWVACLAVLWATASAFKSPSIFSSLVNNAPTSLGNLNWPWSKERCRPPSANLFALHPPRPSNDLIIKASENLDKYLTDRVSKPDIDSISIAVVTSTGPIFEAGYGVLRANESDPGEEVRGEDPLPVDRDSIYRIASISKMFTVLETLILRERGALSWDDPVEKYLPDFSPPSESYGWANHLAGLQAGDEKPRITLRQLASHLAGIGRDYPPSDVGDWPLVDPPQSNSLASGHVRTPEYDELMDSVAEYPLVNTPYLYPIYSNTGISLLGLSNLAANRLASANASAEPQTHKELLKRDIFDPLELNSSFYRIPASDKLRAHIAVPKTDADWADISLGDMSDAAGGQYSSLGDLATLMRTFLAPDAKGAVVSARVVNEWLRPLYVWGESTQRVGAPWEVLSLEGSTTYTKGGNLPGYHSEFALVPEYSVGIIVLVTGTYSDTTTILKEAAKRFLPTFEKLHEVELRRRYVGTWANGEDVAEVVVQDKGALYLKKLVVRGVDVLKLVKAPSPAALWSTGRVGEFRLAIGRPELNDVSNIGCWPYWISIDPGVNSRGAPVDLLYWKNGVLSYPSAGVNLARNR
ncbi:hypothetical protein GALMADRAFT_234319 [Galerina marginata CBS 339.88]|uniref:Beta-lactamase-related domain-containing protein n=1 Tax=Galerina marginata (strain CBS 339.88) TaxID=685588 RepID=A0A067TZM8_GALM3|nr:hypothetical protein GALMADRAFT_234319 [Galerina marginata CBS 339.88]